MTARDAATHRPLIHCVVGARPNFMKIAPLMRVLRKPKCRLAPRLVHTGQHYDDEMSRHFFEQLDIPEADVDLGVGSGSHAVQTAEVMKRYDAVSDAEPPAAVLVVGDVNSTIACSLVAVKKSIPVFHVEAGLRSGDRSMPEEINRVLTDQISELLFTTERAASVNLEREGIDLRRVHFVGNVMIDTLLASRDRAVPCRETLSGAGAADELLAGNEYALLTLHRPSNVDDPVVLERLIIEVSRLSERLPVVFPAHPRTAARIASAGLDKLLETPRILRLGPMGYLETLGLMEGARMVLTDSGGMQEETTVLGVPCITLRENTERPVTIAEGSNVLVGTSAEALRCAVAEVLRGGGRARRVPELWDGRAAERIGDVIDEWAKETFRGS